MIFWGSVPENNFLKVLLLIPKCVEGYESSLHFFPFFIHLLSIYHIVPHVRCEQGNGAGVK